MVAVNQTRSQVEGISRDKKYHLSVTASIHKRVLPGYMCLDNQIRQILIKLEANRIQNEGIERNSYGNRNKEHEIGFYK